MDTELGETDAAEAALVPELALAELTQVWTLGVGSDRSLGRPKEWNGEPSSFDDFAFKVSNWLSGLPGDAERFLEESVTMAQPIQWATLTPRENVVARGVATALRALIGGKALSCTRHHPEKLNGFEMWRLLYMEYKPDTATRKVGLLERVMDDQQAPGMDFGAWFLRWLDLVGECEKARGRMIDDDIKVAVMLKRSPKELRDHLVLESPQLANVEYKFPVMRELIQHLCQSRRVFFPQKPPMEVAAVSTAARDSDVTVSAVGWHGSWHEKGHGKGKSREKGKVKGKGKARERKARRKEERKARERATVGKRREIGGTSIMIRGGWNRSVVTVVTVGNGVTRRPSALNGRGVVRWNLVQWCHILHRLLFLTLDPLCRNVFKL